MVFAHLTEADKEAFFGLLDECAHVSALTSQAAP